MHVEDKLEICSTYLGSTRCLVPNLLFPLISVCTSCSTQTTSSLAVLPQGFEKYFLSRQADNHFSKLVSKT